MRKATEKLRAEQSAKKKPSLPRTHTPKTLPQGNPTPPSNKRKKKAKRPPPTRAELEALAKKKRRDDRKREKRTLKSLWRKVAGDAPQPSTDRWERRREEIRAFQRDIQSATFDALLTQWKRHVGLTAYIEHTGHNTERLGDYRGLLTAIEREWERRSKLTYSSDEYFDWPTTKTGIGKGRIGQIDWAAEGALAYLGYHVGESSDLRRSERQALLRRVFEMQLPPIESADYVRSWGKPSTAPRLKKMADSIASFARSAKRRSNDMQVAVSDWESDLAMLYNEFYVAKFGFGWPTI